MQRGNSYLISNRRTGNSKTNSLYVTSRKETINSPINRFKVCTVKMPASLSKHLVLYLIHYFKKHFKPCFFILKAFKDILQHFEFVNW